MKRILMLLMSLATVMQLASCAPWPSTGVKGEFSRALGVNLTDGHTVEEEDTHGGFLGDGDTTLILTFTGENRTALEEEIAGADGWKALPLTENLNRVVYEDYFGDLCEDVPQDLTDGWYYFLDRHSEAENPEDDSGLFGRGSYNFTLAIYDKGSGVLYCYEMDT